jgi:hypothetical protein
MAHKNTHGVDILIRPDEEAARLWLERHIASAVNELAKKSGLSLSAKVVPIRKGVSALSIEVAR